MSREANDDDRTDRGPASPRGRTPDGREALEGTVVRYDDEPDRCTLHPADPTERGSTTEWITAEEGSYVSATAWR